MLLALRLLAVPFLVVAGVALGAAAAIGALETEIAEARGK